MKQFAWYSPELNAIVLQTFMQDCQIAFEWYWYDVVDAYALLGYSKNIISEFLWFPLGEL